MDDMNYSEFGYKKTPANAGVHLGAEDTGLEPATP